MAPPLVSVIVCTHNQAVLLEQCLQSLVAQTLSPDQYEVVVVDNNSTDHTQTIVGRFICRYPHIKVVAEQRIGVSHARNTGVACSQADYVAFIDDDAQALPDWVKKIVAAFRQTQPTPAVVGGQTFPHYVQSPPGWFLDGYETITRGSTKRFLNSRWDCYGICGMNMAFNKRLILRFGGFPTDFGHVGKKVRLGEETSLVLRLYENDLPIWYDPTIRVKHLVPISKMTMRYRLRRSYQGGIAISRIEGTTIFSRKTWAAITSRLTKLLDAVWPGRKDSRAGWNIPCQPVEKPHQKNMRQKAVANAIFIAGKAGRYRGMRLW